MRKNLFEENSSIMDKKSSDYFDPEVFSLWFDKFKRYYRIYNKIFIPIEWEVDPLLADWFWQLFLDPKKLSDKQQKELTAIVPKRQHLWLRNFTQYHLFLKDKKQGIVFSKKQIHNWRIWLYLQREMFRKGKLSEWKIELMNTLEVALDFDSGKEWEEKYNELAAYKAEYGHCKLTAKNTPSAELLHWVFNQRSKERKSNLPEEHFKKLSLLGFAWSKKIKKERSDKWEERFEELEEYKNKFGTCKIPITHEKYKPLFTWVATQRENERTGKLSKKRKKKLESIDFPFSNALSGEKEKRWKEMFELLRVFYHKHGHSKVSNKKIENRPLATWVAHQRKYADNLTKEQKQQLRRVKFQWDGDFEKEEHKRWMAFYKSLEVFNSANGHTIVPDEGEFRKLAGWVYRQRINKEKLTKDQVQLLNQLKFDWNRNYTKLRTDQWSKHYQELVEFHKKHNHSRVPQTYKENQTLASWVLRQRLSKDNLSKEKLFMLKQVDFLWSEDLKNTEAEQWKNNYDALVKYYNEFKKFSFPSNNKEYKNLGGWLSGQRKLNKLGKLIPERIQLLKQIKAL